MTDELRCLPAWTPRRIAGVEVAHGPIAPGTRFRGHEHDGIHLCCVLEGGFVESVRGGPVDAGPGTVRVSAAARHDIDFSRVGARCVVIQLTDEDAGALGGLDRAKFLCDPWLARLVSQLGNTVNDGRVAARLALESQVAELFAQIARRNGVRAATTPPAWLEATRDRVRAAEGRKSLAELAAAARVHPAHLARAFRDHFGTTLGQFGRRLRIERALGLLAAGEQSLAEIAIETGFADQSHMTRALSSATGMSPGRLRTRRHPPRANPVQDRGAGGA